MNNNFYGWKLIAALSAIIFINVGFVFFGSGVIAAPMVKELGLDRSLLGLGFTIFTMAQGLLTPLASMAVNRLGPRLTLTYGSLVQACLCFLLAYVTQQGWHYVIVFGVGVGLGIVFSGLVPALACVMVWFSAKRGLALSVVMAASGMGGFVAAPLINAIITAADGNWRAGWYLVGACVLVSAAIAFFFVRNDPAELGQQPDGGVPADAAAGSTVPAASIYRSDIDWTLKDALRTRSMWLIVLASIGYVIPLTVFMAHGVMHLKGIGHTPAAAALALGLLALCGVVGKIGAGYLCDRIESRLVWAGCLMAEAAGIVVVANAGTQMEIYVFAILMGIGYGACTVCWPAMLANYFGAKAYPTIIGIQGPLNVVGTSAAPVIAGLMFDHYNTYSTVFIGIGALTLATGILLLLATPPRHGQS